MSSRFTPGVQHSSPGGIGEVKPMDADSTSQLERELLTHTGWLRALARSLVADLATADDLVQETWLAALRRPPRERGNLRAWLGRVLKNAAFQRARSEGRRVQRELEAGEPTPLASPEEVAAKLDTQRRLTALVAELEEPYRSTLLLRYYEGHTSAEIGRRTGVPAGTVRWRLSRALEELRDRLDADHDGDRRVWCAALGALIRGGESAPLAPSAPTGTTTLTLLQGALGVKLLTISAGCVALLLLVVAGITGWPFSGPSPSEYVVPSAPAEVSFRALAPPAVEDERTAVRVETPESAAADDPAIEESDTVTNHVLARILDESGTPLADAELRHVGRGWGPHVTSATSGPDGRVLLPVAESRLQLDDLEALELLVARPGHASVFRRAMWRVGEDVHLGDVRLAPGGAIQGRVVDEAGSPIEGAWVKLTDRLPDRHTVEQERRSEQDWGGEGGLPPTHTDAVGEFTLSGVPAGYARLCAGGDGWLASWSAPIEVRAGAESFGIELALERRDPREWIAGIVLDPEGDPVPHADLNYSYRSSGAKGGGSTSVDRDGRFEIDVRRRSEYDLRASDDRNRWGDAVLEGVEPGTHDIVLRLTEPITTQLFVTSSDERFRAFSVSVRAPDHSHTYAWLSEQIPSEEGLELNVPRARFVVEVLAEGHEFAVLGPYDGEGVPAELRTALVSLPGVRGVVRASGAAVAGATVELYELADERIEHNGFAVSVDPSSRARGESDAQGRFDLTLRGAGTFLLRAEADGFAATELGPFRIDPEVGMEGIEVELGPGGAIEGFVLVPAESEPAGTIVAINRGDAHARTMRVGADGRFRFERLTPGAYEVRVTDEELDPTRSQTSTNSWKSPHVIEGDCVVSAGRTTWYDLDLGGGAEPCVVHGTLRLDGGVPGPWRVTLLPFGETRWVVGDHPSTTLGPDGEFSLRSREPGAYDLLFAAPGDEGEVTRLMAPIELEQGERDFSLALATGTVVIENAEPWPGGDESPASLRLHFLVWERDGVRALIPVGGDEARRCELPQVPAGHLRVCRLGPTELLQPEPDLSRWPTLTTLELPAGERVTVRLP